MSRRGKWQEQAPRAVVKSRTGRSRPAPAPVVQAPPVEPVERIWVPGPAYVMALGYLARAVEARRGVEALASVGEARRALDRLNDRAVALARAEGATWAEVGAAFGITRQSAQVRWRQGPRPVERACHFAGTRDGCQQVATTARGAVPLCEPCEASSSSLKRLPRGAPRR